MFRLIYIIPRLVILLVVLILIRYGLDPILRLGGQRLGSSVAKAKVGIADVNASIFRGSIHLDRVEIANRKQPMRNVFQFDEAWLELSTSALAERRLVVPYAVIRGLQFDTPRTESGALDPKEQDEASQENYFGEYKEFVTEQASDRARIWFDDLERRLSGDLRSEFESIELSEQLLREWRLRAENLQGDFNQWRSRIEGYQELIRTIRSNPLRHLDLIAQRLGEIETTHQEIIRASKQVGELQGQLRRDKEALLTAKDHDVNRLRELAQIENLDPQSFAEYLLGESLGGQLANVIAWANRGRQAAEIGLRRPDLNRQSGRGTLFPMRPADSQIDLLVERLAFSGRADSLTFAGIATNLTHQPKQHGKPAVIELSTSGRFGARIRAEVDLTSDQPTYHFVAMCPEFPQPRRSLGDEGQFTVEVAPGPAALRVELHLTGDQLTGDVRWRQDELKLAPKLDGRYANLASIGIERAFDTVDSFHAKVDVSGSLEKPNWDLATNLGHQLSDGLRIAAEGQLQHLADDLMVRLESEAADNLGQLDGLLAEQATQLSKSLESLQSIQQQLSDRWKLPAGQLGNLLPLGKLLR